MWVEEDSIHCFTEPIGTGAEPRDDTLPNQSAQPQSFARTKRTATKSFRGTKRHCEQPTVIASNQPSLRATNRHCEEQQTVIARNSKASLRGTANRHCEEQQTVIARLCKPSLRVTAKRHCE